MTRKLFLASSALVAAVLSAAGVNAVEKQANDTNGLFNTIEIASNNLKALPQWTHVIDSFPDVKKNAARCDADIQNCKSQQMTLWRAKIQELELSTPMAQIREINQFINKWRRASDSENYQKQDYWASPLEFITNGGDSEDFAIMKYVSLKELGISPSKMRIVVTNDVLRGVTHAFLSVEEGKNRFVLDSQNDTVLKEDLVNYYIPFYSVNEKTRWAHVPNQAATVNTAAGVEKND